LSTDWGVRLFATDSPSYDPLSYNDGSVWPFVTGFTMLAEYKNHRAQAALQHLYGVSALTGFSGPGFIPEYMGGDRAQQLSRAVPHQLFSSTAVIHPLISGLLGLDGDALTSTLTVAPHLPADWNDAILALPHRRIPGERGVRAGQGIMRVRLSVDGEPLRCSSALPGQSLISAELNAKRSRPVLRQRRRRTPSLTPAQRSSST
jgi:hypothetical protein